MHASPQRTKPGLVLNPLFRAQLWKSSHMFRSKHLDPWPCILLLCLAALGQLARLSALVHIQESEISGYKRCVFGSRCAV